MATAHDALARPLAKTSFVVVDLETTGGSADRGDAIIEIGAVRVASGRLAERFARLVNPGRRLPPFITRLTGITDAMLADQPDIRVAIAEFLTFAGDDVLVAHNARFDLPFLDAALRLALGRAFHQPHFCTLRLARRLLPNLRRRSLDSLAGHLGIPVVDRHRALGDAIMTAEVLLHFLELLDGAGSPASITPSTSSSEPPTAGASSACFRATRSMSCRKRPGSTASPATDGRLLYIGKAMNLRQRVSSYLSNSAGHSRKTLDLIRHLRDVEVRVTGSELEASLLEAEEIRRCQPPYNRLRKHLPRIAFLKLSVANEFPRLSITSRVTGRGARFFGPFRSRVAARRALDLLARLFRLRTCAGRRVRRRKSTPCLQGQIDACSAPVRRARRPRPLRRTGSASAALLRRAEPGSPPRAGAASRRSQCGAALRGGGAHSARHRAARADGQEAEAAQLDRRAPPLRGSAALRRRRRRHAVRRPARPAAGEAPGGIGGRAGRRSRRAWRRVCASAADRLRPPDVDGTTILAAWLRERGERDGYVFPLAGADSVEERLPEWAAALDSLLALRASADADAVQ